MLTIFVLAACSWHSLFEKLNFFLHKCEGMHYTHHWKLIQLRTYKMHNNHKLQSTIWSGRLCFSDLYASVRDADNPLQLVVADKKMGINGIKKKKKEGQRCSRCQGMMYWCAKILKRSWWGQVLEGGKSSRRQERHEKILDGETEKLVVRTLRRPQGCQHGELDSGSISPASSAILIRPHYHATGLTARPYANWLNN